MKSFSKEKFLNTGIPLRNLNAVMFFLAVIVSIFLIIAMRKTISMYEHTHETTQNLNELRREANNLQVGSDYLTEQSRCFVVIGKKKYLDNRDSYIGKKLYITFGERSGVNQVPFHIKEVKLYNEE